MKTILKLGPRDQGRALPLEDFEAARYRRGFQYELIEGRLYATPVPSLPHDCLAEWVANEVRAYARLHRGVIEYITTRARVFLPGKPNVTAPEPDLAVYDAFPSHVPVRQRDWRTVSPVLVIEVVSEDDPDKDLVRNVELYRQVPSIREYWIIDPWTEGP